MQKLNSVSYLLIILAFMFISYTANLYSKDNDTLLNYFKSVTLDTTVPSVSITPETGVRIYGNKDIEFTSLNSFLKNTRMIEIYTFIVKYIIDVYSSIVRMPSDFIRAILEQDLKSVALKSFINFIQLFISSAFLYIIYHFTGLFIKNKRGKSVVSHLLNNILILTIAYICTYLIQTLLIAMYGLSITLLQFTFYTYLIFVLYLLIYNILIDKVLRKLLYFVGFSRIFFRLLSKWVSVNTVSLYILLLLYYMLSFDGMYLLLSTIIKLVISLLVLYNIMLIRHFKTNVNRYLVALDNYSSKYLYVQKIQFILKKSSYLSSSIVLIILGTIVLTSTSVEFLNILSHMYIILIIIVVYIAVQHIGAFFIYKYFGKSFLNKIDSLISIDEEREPIYKAYKGSGVFDKLLEHMYYYTCYMILIYTIANIIAHEYVDLVFSNNIVQIVMKVILFIYGVIILSALIVGAVRALTMHLETTNNFTVVNKIMGLFVLCKKVYIVLVLVGFIVYILSLFGVSIKALLASTGVATLALGFAARDALTNFFKAIVFLFEDAFYLGDYIEIDGRKGVVEKITGITVQLRSVDGTLHLIPFSNINIISNVTKEYSCMLEDVPVGYTDDLDHVMLVIREVGKSLENDIVLKHYIKTSIVILGVYAFNDSSIAIRCRIKTHPNKHFDVGYAFRKKIKEQFDIEGIEIPLPYRVLINKEDNK